MLLADIRSAFALSGGPYGSPRMTRELAETRGVYGWDGGLTVGRRRTAQLMRENDLKLFSTLGKKPSRRLPVTSTASTTLSGAIQRSISSAAPISYLLNLPSELA